MESASRPAGPPWRCHAHIDTLLDAHKMTPSCTGTDLPTSTLPPTRSMRLLITDTMSINRGGTPSHSASRSRLQQVKVVELASSALLMLNTKPTSSLYFMIVRLRALVSTQVTKSSMWRVMSMAGSDTGDGPTRMWPCSMVVTAWVGVSASHPLPCLLPPPPTHIRHSLGHLQPRDNDREAAARDRRDRHLVLDI